MDVFCRFDLLEHVMSPENHFNPRNVEGFTWLYAEKNGISGLGKHSPLL